MKTIRNKKGVHDFLLCIIQTVGIAQFFHISIDSSKDFSTGLLEKVRCNGKVEVGIKVQTPL